MSDIPLQKLPAPARFSPGGLGKDPYVKDFFLELPLHLLYEYDSSYKNNFLSLTLDRQWIRPFSNPLKTWGKWKDTSKLSKT
jgi:hypothetical protein